MRDASPGEAAIVGALSNTLSLSITYPLTTITARQQVEEKGKMKKTQSLQAVNTATGPSWKSYYNGLQPAMFSTFITMGIHFWFYQAFTSMAKARGVKQGPVTSLGLTSLAGCCNVLLTNPMWVVVTRMQVASKGQESGVMDVVTELLSEPEGVIGLWKGLGPAMLMVSNPAIVFMVYETLAERMLAILRTKAAAGKAPEAAARAKVVLSSATVFLLGAFAKLVSTVVTFPMLVVKSRLQAMRKQKLEQGEEKAGVKHVVAAVVKENGGWPAGLLGLYSGIQAKVFQTVLNTAIMFVLKERLTQLVLNARRLNVKSA